MDKNGNTPATPARNVGHTMSHIARAAGIARRLLPLAIFLLVAVDIALLPAPIPAAHPNVIVVSIDSLREDHMGLYGYARDTTPNIDAWAKEERAFVFENYFATSYLTPVSEASVQTGRYPFENGIINFTASPRGATKFLAEILKQQGYATAAFGSSPEYLINPALAEDFSRGFDVYAPFASSTDPAHPGVPTPACRTSLAPVADAVRWMRTQEAARKPFYLWLPLGGVHAPFNDGAPGVFDDPSYRGFLRAARNDEFDSVYGFIFDGTRFAPGDVTRGPRTRIGVFSAADERYVVNRYDDGIRATDALLAPLFAYLKNSGLDRNTVVVLESEHGETLGERGYIAHYDIHDETTHVPLVIKAPGIPGRRIAALASGVDILPTVLSLAGQNYPMSDVGYSDGIDYRAYLSGLAASTPRSNVFITRTPLWERITGAVPAFTKADNVAHYHDTAVRSQKWKLIHRIARDAEARWGWWGLLTGHSQNVPEYELYDLANDPGETLNVYDARADDPAVRALKEKLDAFDASIVTNLPGPSTDQLQPYF